MIASNPKPRVTPKQLDRYDRERQAALYRASLGPESKAQKLLQLVEREDRKWNRRIATQGITLSKV
ncbi:MAG: hypothetical protein DMG80_11985 [Acidobacteria bacterium]|nr:MAG: hypothetical protein DMG80_11985 [Acidobacteriota bacterium]